MRHIKKCSGNYGKTQLLREITNKSLRGVFSLYVIMQVSSCNYVPNYSYTHVSKSSIQTYPTRKIESLPNQSSKFLEYYGIIQLHTEIANIKPNRCTISLCNNAGFVVQVYLPSYSYIHLSRSPIQKYPTRKIAKNRISFWEITE